MKTDQLILLVNTYFGTSSFMDIFLDAFIPFREYIHEHIINEDVLDLVEWLYDEWTWITKQEIIDTLERLKVMLHE